VAKLLTADRSKSIKGKQKMRFFGRLFGGLENSNNRGW